MECGTACNNVTHFWRNSARIMPKTERIDHARRSEDLYWADKILGKTRHKWCVLWISQWPQRVISFTKNSGQTYWAWNQNRPFVELMGLHRSIIFTRSHIWNEMKWHNDICLIGSDCIKWSLKTNQRFNLITTSRDPSDYKPFLFPQEKWFLRESLLTIKREIGLDMDSKYIGPI